MRSTVNVNVPSKSQAMRIARRALKSVASPTTDGPAVMLEEGSIADEINLAWTFHRKWRAVDRSILIAIQRRFASDQDIIEKLADFIIEAAVEARRGGQ